ncbi:MAG: IS66 family insertion sequence element accessory protein TnpB [Pseudomonadota bacterium]
MIRPSKALHEVYLCVEPVDFRKQANALAAMVEADLHFDPFSEQVFVFTNKRRDSVRCLVWERNGFVLWSKKLQKERFYWPRRSSTLTTTLSGEALNFLLDGYDLSLWRGHRRLSYQHVV